MAPLSCDPDAPSASRPRTAFSDWTLDADNDVDCFVRNKHGARLFFITNRTHTGPREAALTFDAPHDVIDLRAGLRARARKVMPERLMIDERRPGGRSSRREQEQEHLLAAPSGRIMADMVHVIATITVKSGQRRAFVEAFKQLVPTVSAEEGCLAYGPNIDVPSGIDRQAPPDDNAVIVIEQWQSVAHLEAHLAAPHMLAFREQHGHLVESLVLRICEPA